MTIPAQRVHIPALGITGYLIAVVPNSAVGGEAKFRVRWYEPAARDGKAREANFWLSYLVFEQVEVEAA